MKLYGTLSSVGRLEGSLTSGHSLRAVLTGGISRIEPLPYYDGDYEITPTQEQQVIRTEQKSMSGDMIIKPIPNNYGLITWNGSIITVS